MKSLAYFGASMVGAAVFGYCLGTIAGAIGELLIQFVVQVTQ